jgi:Xaa-Pro aminopeptidase
MANRLSQVRRRLAEFDADAVLLSALPNVRWACGFTGSNGLLVVGTEDAVFVTDGRYTEQARQEVGGAEVVIATEGLLSRLEELEYFDAYDQVLFQADHVTVAREEQLREHLPDIQWEGETNLLQDFVATKESGEVDRIRRAQRITETVFDHILPLLEPGITEREVAAEITYQHLKRGAEKMAFDPIVASGANGARPHARPTDRELRTNEFIVIDMGCFCRGYASDMTRTVALGSVPDAARRGYDVVREAQRRALDAARAGLTGKELDAIARDSIDDAGLGDAFAHGLGHGIGLEVHEWPRVSRTFDAELPEGACVTIEPGVYVPEDGYGVRIEDIVVLREDGCENLTTTSKDLHVL